MLVKIIYEGITCFPDTNEFWNLYIVLMKEKDFFFDAFARETVDLDSPAKYQHAYFTTDGQVLDFNRNMDTKLVNLFRQVILDQQEQFMEEIIMAKQSLIEKKIKAASLELGELMKAHKDKEAWTKAGELNHLLKMKKPKCYLLTFSKKSAWNFVATTTSTEKSIDSTNSSTPKAIS